MNYEALTQILKGSNLDEGIRQLTCCKNVKDEKERYLSLLEQAKQLYQDGDYHIISSSGRTEVGGNHTDHNHGCVVAASVNLDTVAVVKKNNSTIVRIQSKGFDIQPVDLMDLSIQISEVSKTESLIRGIAARFTQLGYFIGGFDAICDSKVLPGSGISSSASFEVLIGQIFNQLFNQDKVNPIEIAQIAQYAENEYFGKPCGLMDQMAISVGGFTAIDFKNPSQPIVEKINVDFNQFGYSLVITNTKGDHANLSNQYSAIPNEMKAVSSYFNKEYLRDISLDQLIKEISNLRNYLQNDRSILRALHFKKENQRAIELKNALKAKNIDKTLSIINESGRSSMMYLQNVTVVNQYEHQNLALALALSDIYLNQQGAFRVHGGGFEGTIQAFVPNDLLDGYLELMQSVFGDDATHVMAIRNVGAVQLI